MQYLLAPSKTMTMTRAYPRVLRTTKPHFEEDAARVVAAVKDVASIARTMQVSESIAARVTSMYGTWGNTTEPALFAYIGDVYRWFYADTLAVDDIRWAQKHLFIMSGLYGALRPLDRVSPYRLEMKAKISVQGSQDLYDFWGKRIARYIDDQAGDIICSLSSDEYAKVVTKYTNKRVVTPIFVDNKTNGIVGTVPIYSKMMRGVMARWAIDHQVDEVARLKEFASQGYSYAADLSDENNIVFYRQVPKPIRF